MVLGAAVSVTALSLRLALILLHSVSCTSRRASAALKVRPWETVERWSSLPAILKSGTFGSLGTDGHRLVLQWQIRPGEVTTGRAELGIGMLV